LKELEHFTFPETTFNYEWEPGYPPRTKRPLPPPAYNYCYLIDSRNRAGHSMNFENRYSLFEMVANNIFQDFGSSDFASHKRGVRVNLDAFLTNFYVSEILDPQDSSKSLLSEAFTTRHSAFGMASIRYPADRIKHACAAKLGEDIMTRLSIGKLPEMEMTRWVFEQFFAPPEKARVKLFIGKSMAEGRPIQRNDILDALNQTDAPGKPMESLIREWCAELQANVKAGVHKTKNIPLSQYLQAEIDKELINFRDERYDPDWQKWGGYARKMRSNKEGFLKREVLGETTPEGRRVQSRLEIGIAEIVNDANKGIQFAKMLLKEIRLIFTEDAYPYLPAFRREAAELSRKVTDQQKAYQRSLDAIRQRENESGVKKLLFGRDTMEHLTEAFFADLQEYMLFALKLRARQEAIEVGNAVLARIGQEGHVIDERTKERTEDTGLMRELLALEKVLAAMKQEFTARKADFSNPQEDELTLFLYEPNDIDETYYRRYMGSDEATRITRVSEQAVQVLDRLPSLQERGQPGIKVMDLPALAQREGIVAVVKMILAETAAPFAKVDDDFEILELFFDKYKTAPDQVGALSLLYKKAQIWLPGATDSNFQLGKEKRICLVGMYEDPNKPSVYETFKKLLSSQVYKPEDPSLAFFPLKSKSEVVFYTEAAGFPICYSSSVHEMRPKYEKLSVERFVNLHADRNEFRFRDILELTEGERKELEEATRVFLLGLLLEVIRVVRDNEDEVFYVEQRVGLAQDQRFLGTQHRAIRVILRDRNLRTQLDNLIQQRESELKKNPDDWARYYATLSYYQQQVYPPLKTTNLAKETREQTTTENLVLRQKLKNIEQTHNGDLEIFRNRAAELSATFAEAAKPLTGNYYAVKHAWAKAASVDL
jgi:Tubulin like